MESDATVGSGTPITHAGIRNITHSGDFVLLEQ